MLFGHRVHKAGNDRITDLERFCLAVLAERLVEADLASGFAERLEATPDRRLFMFSRINHGTLLSLVFRVDAQVVELMEGVLTPF